MLQIIKKISYGFFATLLTTLVVFSGFPSQNLVDFVAQKVRDRNVVDLLYHASLDRNSIDSDVSNLFRPEIPKAHAATFSIQTGYYVGDAVDNRTVSGVGFQPDVVIIKDNTAGGNEGIVVKTSSMAGELSLAWAEADGNLTTNHIQSLDSDGFTIGTDADVNGSNVMFHWIAFGGSDCSATGTLCVGSYTGNGTSQNITSVGFQPDMVWVRRSGASQGIWKSTSMAGTVNNYFINTLELASGGIDSLDATGFTVGANASVNTNANTYYYIAFKEVNNALELGSYVGDGVDNTDIDSADNAALDFQPDFVMVKATSATNGAFSVREHYGDRSAIFNDVASAANIIQKLYSTGGFQVGNNASANASATTYHYAVFGGAQTKAAGTGGDFQMTTGSYTGTGSAFSVTGLPFTPDLVFVKHSDQATDQYAVWRSRMMLGDITHYFSLNATTFAGGITALGSDGFSVGTHATVNTSGDTYYWVAFGNATMPETSDKADNFLIGAYIGSGQDNRDIDRLPMQPDFVHTKQVGGTQSIWASSALDATNSLAYHAFAQTINYIQALNSDGFELGTSVVNGAGSTYHYFAFDENSCTTTGRFCTTTYAGTGSAQNITSVGFQPDFVMTKKITGGTTRAGVFRTSQQTGDSSLPFMNLPLLAGEITNLITNGFSAGTGTGANEVGFNYALVAFNAKRYTQATYRFFANTDSTDVGTTLEAQNTPASLTSTGDAFRLRLTARVDYGNLFTNGKNFKLQYVDKGVGTCASPSGGTPSSYTDVSGATLIAFNNNTTPSDGDALTANANDPTDASRTIVNQSYQESNPFTNDEAAVTNASQTAKWDFALIDNGAPAETTFCFRVVDNDGSVLDTYTNYPEITTAAASAQTLSMTISDNTIGFGTLSTSAARYATGDTSGSASDSADAHTVSASTNASGGYVLLVNGQTLTCTSCGGATVTAIGGTPASSSTGTEQFGLRVGVNSGTGTATSPYGEASQFAFDTGNFPDQIASGDGDGVTTEFGLRYIANIDTATEAGGYEGVLTYTVTASF